MTPDLKQTGSISHGRADSHTCIPSTKGRLHKHYMIRASKVRIHSSSFLPSPISSSDIGGETRFFDTPVVWPYFLYDGVETFRAEIARFDIFTLTELSNQ